MENKNQAIPAETRPSPGVGEHGAGTPPVAPSTPPQQGASGGQQGEANVTLSAEEYRKLLRDSARVRSFEKRREFVKTRNNPSSNTSDAGEDPELVEELHKEQEARKTAETKALKAEIVNRVRDILEKPEYKTLPQSTRDLILKNPHMLSDADNAEEAMLDIEDFVREHAFSAPQNVQPGQGQGGASPSHQPTGHETPPTITHGAPAPVDMKNLEDASKLTGSARSRAILRNAFRQRGGK